MAKEQSKGEKILHIFSLWLARVIAAVCMFFGVMWLTGGIPSMELRYVVSGVVTFYILKEIL